MSHDTHDIKKEVRGYFFVFGALLFFTMVTVLVSYLHVAIHWAIMIALTIAIIKGSLVACYFMHLISERKVIYLILICVVIFFFTLMLLPLTENHDVFDMMKHVS